MGHLRRIAAAACLCAVAARASATTINAASTADLQAALVNAQPGDTIALEPSVVYVGNFTLPAKGSASTFITIRTRGDDAVPDGARVSPTDAVGFAKLRSPNGAPAVQTAPGAHHWRIQLVELQANAGGDGDIVALGDGSSAQNTLASVPHDLVLDRVYVHGDAAVGQKRCVALNSASTTVTGSYVADCKAKGQDSQAIAGWNGPGPFAITNNYLEGAGENVLFGGADPSIPDLVPADITITNNAIAKPAEWRGQSWQVKNLLELKNARRVTIRLNTLEYTWQAAQTGFAVLFTVRNQEGRCPWCEVSDVTFDANRVSHAAGGVSILGVDDNAPSRQTHAIRITSNVFADIDNQHWGGSGYFLMLTGGPRDIAVDHNTVIQDHASGVIQVDGPPIVGFHFTNNLARHNAYGIIGTDHAPGNDTIRAYLPAVELTDNVIADADGSRYPSGNQYPSSSQFRAQFVDYDGGDYRLIPASPWRRAATDGGALGADVTGVPPSGNPPKIPQGKRSKRP
jgi:hypothetical protein